MLKTVQKRKSEGFTIIEVLIVLAIAGLIMVIVFLAVPALHRSATNNELNTDANNVLTAVGNYASNNGGTLPTAVTLGSGGDVTVGASGTGINQSNAKVGSSVSAVTLITGTSGTPITNAQPVGTIQVVTGTNAVCNSDGTGLSGTGSIILDMLAI